MKTKRTLRSQKPKSKIRKKKSQLQKRENPPRNQKLKNKIRKKTSLSNQA
jgi:hypothetical protein